MSLGRIALGLCGIALGVSQIRKGAAHIASVPSAPRRLPGRGSRLGASPTTDRLGYAQTPSGPLRLRTYKIRNLDDRIKKLRELVELGMRDPSVYEFARRAVNGKCGGKWCVDEKDTAGEIKALFEAIRKNVRYTSDIRGIDSYQHPAKTLMLRTFDCDDAATLACATAAAIGIPCRFKVIKTRGSSDWNHIYAQMGLPRQNPTRWVAFDASVGKPCGWEAPKNMVADSRVFRVV
jgi:transglutaminase-like putative cysteine protease